MSKTVKNISEQELAIPNVGVVAAGCEVEVSDDFHNPNFEVVGKKTEPKVETKEDETEPEQPKKTSKK